MHTMRASPQTRSIHAVLDIGSAGVGGALVAYTPDAIPEIVYTTRRMTITHTPTPDALAHTLTQTLQRVVGDLTTAPPLGDIGMGISDIHCVFAAPWYTGKAHSTVRTFEVPTRISDDMLNALADETEKDPDTTTTHVPMERAILSMTANGYPTDTPVGVEAREVALQRYTSSLSSSVYADVCAVLNTHWRSEDIHLHSYALTLATAFRDLAPGDTPSCTIIDVSGEVTDVLIVRDGVLETSASFPYGSNALIRALAERSGATHTEARARLRRFFAHADTAAAHTFTAATLETPTFSWRDQLRRTLTEIADERAIPPETYVAAAAEMHPWFARAAHEMHVPGTAMPLAVQQLDVRALSAYCRTQTGVRFDLFLALAAYYTHVYHSQDAAVAA